MADSTDTPSSRNPFSRRTTLSSQSLLLYKITTTVSYLLFLITTIYYTIHAPHDGDTKHHHNAFNARFWAHNYSTPFAQSAIITSIYWIAIFILQAGYLAAFYSANEEYALAAANLAAHFISSNLLLFGFVHLWVRSHFVLSLLLLVINFANLSTAYFRHSTTPRFIHIGVLSGPLAWNFVALYWAGSVAVWQSHANDQIARIVANVFIWGWVGYAGIFLVGFKDYSIGYALSILAFSTGVGQFLTKPHLFQLQWVFAFTIGGLLFVVATAVGLPGLLGRDPFPRGQIVSEDRERAPLLADD